MGLLKIRLIAAALLFAGCRENSEPLADSGWVREDRLLYHGIPSRVEFRSDPGLPRDLAASAFAEFERIGRVVNAFAGDSEVGVLNALRKQGPVSVSRDLDRLMTLSRGLWAETAGAFDPTIWPLKRLWLDAARADRLPAAEDVHHARMRVGLGRIVPAGDRCWAFESPDAELDFGGIAKGYAVDRVSEMLRAAGVSSGLVQCGGEIVAWGESPSGGPWRIGVQDPLSASRARGVISSRGPIAVSTSGNYEQPVRIGGREYYHVFDPRTGEPISTAILGVTVAVLSGEDAGSRADGLATAMAVLGPGPGLALAESLDGVAVLFFVRDERGRIKTLLSSRMQALYRP